jgi:hypothetical protein
MIDIEFGDCRRSFTFYFIRWFIKGSDKSDHRNKSDKDQHQITQYNLPGTLIMKRRGSTNFILPYNSITVEELQGD